MKNIKDNEDYEELEFIVLDYNSEDGMEDWIKENLIDYIVDGRLIYYKTVEPSSWNPSHSKNLAFKLATGDILCSIWADYYTGVGFARFVNDQFKQDHNIVLTPIDFYKTKKNYSPPGDVLGKVCVKRGDFLRINGFDERMDKHGFEDYDFVNRLEMTGVKRVLIENPAYLQYIKHKDDERYALPTDNLQNLYISYCNPYTSIALFLYKDQTFEIGTLTDNFSNDAENYIYAFKPRDEHFEYSLNEPGWETGTWEDESDNASVKFFFITGRKLHLFCKDTADVLLDKEKKHDFFCITDGGVVDSLLKFRHFISTRSIMENNLKNKIQVANADAFGKATIFKNFNDEFPIINN